MSDLDEWMNYDDEPSKSRERAESLVYWPTVVIGVLAFLQFFASLFGIAWFTSALIWGWIRPHAPYGDEAWPVLVAGILAFAICATLNVIIMRGAYEFRDFRHHRFVVYTVLLFSCSVPFVFCGLLALPVALWSILVLRNYDVRARFDAVARGGAINCQKVE